MKRRKPGFPNPLLPLAFVSIFSLYQSAVAAPCTEQIDALKTALNDSVCINSKVCRGLTHKLDNANHKLEQGKFDHAARKLADFSAVVENLTMRKKPRISLADYESIIVPYFNEAAICINNDGVMPEETLSIAADNTPSNTDDAVVSIPSNIVF